MTKAARKSTSPVPPVGSLMRMPFGSGDVVVTVLEDRGPLGVGGAHIVRISFFLEAVEEPVVTEVRLSKLTLIALPDDPPEKRVGVEPSGHGWVGTYTAPEGRIAVVTDVAATPERAKRAAVRWVKAGRTDASNVGFDWRPHERQLGRYSVFRRGRLGDELVVEPT